MNVSVALVSSCSRVAISRSTTLACVWSSSRSASANVRVCPQKPSIPPTADTATRDPPVTASTRPRRELGSQLMVRIPGEPALLDSFPLDRIALLLPFRDAGGVHVDVPVSPLHGDGGGVRAAGTLRIAVAVEDDRMALVRRKLRPLCLHVLVVHVNGAGDVSLLVLAPDPGVDEEELVLAIQHLLELLAGDDRDLFRDRGRALTAGGARQRHHHRHHHPHGACRPLPSLHGPLLWRSGRGSAVDRRGSRPDQRRVAARAVPRRAGRTGASFGKELVRLRIRMSLAVVTSWPR